MSIKKTIISFVHHFPSLISTASQMDLNVSSHMRLNVSTLYSTCQLQIGRASIVHRKCSFTLHLSIICSLSTYHHNSVSGYISQHHAIISTCQCSFGANWSAASQRTHAIQRAASSHAKNIACIGISSQRLWLYHQSPQLNNNLKTPTVLPTTICLCSIQCFRIWNLVLRTRGQQHSMGDKKELFSQMR